ncbi:hypothetical protein T484DRAFT_1879499, partial [Baffinella frigidus]
MGVIPAGCEGLYEWAPSSARPVRREAQPGHRRVVVLSEHSQRPREQAHPVWRQEVQEAYPNEGDDQRQARESAARSVIDRARLATTHPYLLFRAPPSFWRSNPRMLPRPEEATGVSAHGTTGVAGEAHRGVPGHTEGLGARQGSQSQGYPQGQGSVYGQGQGWQEPMW